MAVGLSRGQISNSAGTIYTVPSSTTTKIGTILVHNTNTTSETVKIYAVPNSGGSVGTATDAHLLFNISLASNASFEFSPKFPIDLTAANDTIQAVTTNASKVNYNILGIENSV